MADDLLDAPGAAELFEHAQAQGLELRARLAGGDDDLRPTEVAQPALLFVAVLLTGMLDPAVEVVGVSGHSVGEYAALAAAGALPAAAAMRLVVARGQAMASMREGTMAALLGIDAGAAEQVCREVDDRGLGPVVVANLNAPGQVVISGTVPAVRAAGELAGSRGARRVLPLNVSGAFHSPLMEDAAEHFAGALDAAPLVEARVPVACNVDGQLVTDAGGLRARLRRQLTGAVRWSDCVEALVSLRPDALVEVGSGGVLTGLARRIAPAVTALSVATPDDARSLGERLVAAGA
jgi:[acyl-carrier-protein] S-malonyltransferase